MTRKMQKADPAAPADEGEGSNVKPDEAPVDHEEATEGISEESGEPPDSAKSEDPASDSEHISHPRPEDGEEEQRGGPGMGKSDDDDEDDWGEDEGEDEAEKAENTEEEEGALTAEAKRERNDESIKSLTAGDLNKSLARLQKYAERGGTPGRKDNLLQKAQAGQTLSKSERAELFDLLGNKPPQAKQPLVKSVTRGLQNNQGLQKALDVSEYLAEQHNELTKSLGVLSTHIERSDSRQHEFNLVLAKALADVGNLVKAMGEQMEIIGNQPARSPKSRGVPGSAVLQKGMAGGEPQGDTLSKSQVMDTMEMLLADNIKKGGNGILNGEDISTAITKFESFNQISPSMHQAVMQQVRGNKPA